MNETDLAIWPVFSGVAAEMNSKSHEAVAATPTTSAIPPVLGPHVLPPLPYDVAALEPCIDARTMHLHHDEHHGAYVKKLNEVLAPFPELRQRSAQWLLLNSTSLPVHIRADVVHNAGGHLNHSLFWNAMAPVGGKGPTGALAAVIDSSFKSLDNFKALFAEAGVKRFGSGWVWLVETTQPTATHRKLEIVTTAGHETPLQQNQFPLLLNDVWEHAYYLRYENRRAEYLQQWWQVVNWHAVMNTFDRRNAASEAAAVALPLAAMHK